MFTNKKFINATAWLLLVLGVLFIPIPTQIAPEIILTVSLARETVPGDLKIKYSALKYPHSGTQKESYSAKYGKTIILKKMNAWYGILPRLYYMGLNKIMPHGYSCPDAEITLQIDKDLEVNVNIMNVKQIKYDNRSNYVKYKYIYLNNKLLIIEADYVLKQIKQLEIHIEAPLDPSSLDKQIIVIPLAETVAGGWQQ